MFGSDLMWRFCHLTSTWKSSLRGSISKWRVRGILDHEIELLMVGMKIESLRLDFHVEKGPGQTPSKHENWALISWRRRWKLGLSRLPRPPHFSSWFSINSSRLFWGFLWMSISSGKLLGDDGWLNTSNSFTDSIRSTKPCSSCSSFPSSSS